MQWNHKENRRGLIFVIILTIHKINILHFYQFSSRLPDPVLTTYCTQLDENQQLCQQRQYQNQSTTDRLQQLCNHAEVHSQWSTYTKTCYRRWQLFLQCCIFVIVWSWTLLRADSCSYLHPNVSQHPPGPWWPRPTPWYYHHNKLSSYQRCIWLRIQSIKYRLHSKQFKTKK